MNPPTRILLADDHALVRRGLRLILDGEADLSVVAEAADGAEAVRMAARGGVDLAVLDIGMPRMTGLEAARQIGRRCPEVAMLMPSMHDSEQYLLQAVRAGAAAYVVKSVADRDLVAACRAVVRGDPFPHPGIDGPVVDAALARRSGAATTDRVLTAREEEGVAPIRPVAAADLG